MLDVDSDGDIDVIICLNKMMTKSPGMRTMVQKVLPLAVSPSANAKEVFAIDVDSDGDIDVLSAF